MILLLGASGYVGQAFAREMRLRRISFMPLTQKAFDYSDFDLLFDYTRKLRPEFIINAAGFPGNASIDACESAREQALSVNTLLPQTVARVAAMTNAPWAQVSSGDIYQGAKVSQKGRVQVERDLNRPQLRQMFAEHPEAFGGFTEQNEPNFSFRHPPCSFYSGTKALAEEAIQEVGQGYIWRPKLFFNERDEPWNLLWKIQNYPRVYDCVNSLSHLDDFVRACLDLWEWQAPFGTYNVVNPGAVTSPQIVEMIQRILKPPRHYEFWVDDEEFYRCWAKAPRSNCILDDSKLRSVGVKLRPALEALESALEHWGGEPFADWADRHSAADAGKSLDSGPTLHHLGFVEHANPSPGIAGPSDR